MIRRYALFAVMASGLLLFLHSCSGEYQPAREMHDGEDSVITKDSIENDANTADSVLIGTAQTDEIVIQQMQSSPVQVRVLVQGNLPDGCTQLDSAKVDRNENMFIITMQTRRPKGAMCTQALVPYEKIIPLDVSEVQARQINVSVNGTIKTVNLLKQDPEDKRD